MKLSEVKQQLIGLQDLVFLLPDGTRVPDHFHITEVGVVNKHFIDCGGTVRTEQVANFQLWNANDTEHRLKPQKLLNIIALSEQVLGLQDLDVEVEYQSGTVGKFGLDFNGEAFVLRNKFTDCLASDACGIPQEKRKVKLSELVINSGVEASCCTPGGGCC